MAVPPEMLAYAARLDIDSDGTDNDVGDIAEGMFTRLSRRSDDGEITGRSLHVDHGDSEDDLETTELIQYENDFLVDDYDFDPGEVPSFNALNSSVPRDPVLDRFLSVARHVIMFVKYPTKKMKKVFAKPEDREMLIAEDEPNQFSIRSRKPGTKWQPKNDLELPDLLKVVRGEDKNAEKFFGDDEDPRLFFSIILHNGNAHHLRARAEEIRDFWADGIEALIEYNRKVELSATIPSPSQQNSLKHGGRHRRGPSLSFNLLSGSRRHITPPSSDDEEDEDDSSDMAPDRPESKRAASNLQGLDRENVDPLDKNFDIGQVASTPAPIYVVQQSPQQQQPPQQQPQQYMPPPVLQGPSSGSRSRSRDDFTIDLRAPKDQTRLSRGMPRPSVESRAAAAAMGRMPALFSPVAAAGNPHVSPSMPPAQASVNAPVSPPVNPAAAARVQARATPPRNVSRGYDHNLQQHQELEQEAKIRLLQAQQQRQREAAEQRRKEQQFKKKYFEQREVTRKTGGVRPVPDLYGGGSSGSSSAVSTPRAREARRDNDIHMNGQPSHSRTPSSSRPPSRQAAPHGHSRPPSRQSVSQQPSRHSSSASSSSGSSKKQISTYDGSDELRHFLSVARIGIHVIKFPTYGGFLSKEEPRELAVIEDTSGRCTIRWRKPHETEWQDDKVMYLRDCQQVIRGGDGDASTGATKLFRKDGDHDRLLAIIGSLRSLHIKVKDPRTRDFWANGIEALIRREKELIQQAVDSVNAVTRRFRPRTTSSPPVAAQTPSSKQAASQAAWAQSAAETPPPPMQHSTPRGAPNHNRATGGAPPRGHEPSPSYQPDAYQKVFLEVFGQTKLVGDGGEDVNGDATGGVSYTNLSMGDTTLTSVGGDTFEVAKGQTPAPGAAPAAAAGAFLQLNKRLEMAEIALNSYTSGDVSHGDSIVRDAKERWLRLANLTRVSDVAVAPGHTSGPYVEMRPAVAKRGEVARWENKHPFHKVVMAENEGASTTWQEEVRVEGAKIQRDMSKEFVWNLDMPSIDVKPGPVANYEAPPFLQSEAARVCGDPPRTDRSPSGYRVWLCGKRTERSEWEQLGPPVYLQVLHNRPGSPQYNPNLSQATFLYAIDRKTNYRYCIHKVSPKVNYTNQFGPVTEGDAFLADKWIQWRHLAEGIDRALLFEDSRECLEAYAQICEARYPNLAEQSSAHRVWIRDPMSDKPVNLVPLYAAAATHKAGYFLVLKRHPEEPTGRTTRTFKIHDNTQFHNLQDYRQIHSWDRRNRRWTALCFETSAGCEGSFEFITSIPNTRVVNPNILRAWWVVYINDEIESIESVCVQLNAKDDRGAWVRVVHSNDKVPVQTFLVAQTKFVRESDKVALVAPEVQYDPSRVTKLRFDTPDECGIVVDAIKDASVMHGCRRGIPCTYIRGEKEQHGTYSVWFVPNTPDELDFDASKPVGVWLHWELDATSPQCESLFVTDSSPVLFSPAFGSSVQVWDRDGGVWHRFATQSKTKSALLFRSLTDYFQHPVVHHPTCEAGERVWLTTGEPESSANPMMLLRWEVNESPTINPTRPRGTWLRCYRREDGDTVFEQQLASGILYELYPTYKSIRLFKAEGRGKVRDVTITFVRSSAFKDMRNLLKQIAEAQAIGTVKSPHRKELLLHGESYVKLIENQRAKQVMERTKKKEDLTQKNDATAAAGSRTWASDAGLDLPSLPEHEILLHVPWSVTQPVLELKYEDPAIGIDIYEDMSDALTVVDARWTAELANEHENLTFVVNRYVPVKTSMRAPKASDSWYALYWEYRAKEPLNSMKNMSIFSSIVFPRGHLLSDRSYYWTKPAPSEPKREMTMKFPSLRNPFKSKHEESMEQRNDARHTNGRSRDDAGVRNGNDSREDSRSRHSEGPSNSSNNEKTERLVQLRKTIGELSKDELRSELASFGLSEKGVLKKDLRSRLVTEVDGRLAEKQRKKVERAMLEHKNKRLENEAKQRRDEPLHNGHRSAGGSSSWSRASRGSSGQQRGAGRTAHSRHASTSSSFGHKQVLSPSYASHGRQPSSSSSSHGRHTPSSSAHGRHTPSSSAHSRHPSSSSSHGRHSSSSSSNSRQPSSSSRQHQRMPSNHHRQTSADDAAAAGGIQISEAEAMMGVTGVVRPSQQMPPRQAPRDRPRAQRRPR